MNQEQYLRVRLGLRNASDALIVSIGLNVIDGLKGNKAFPKPAVDLATLQSAVDEFRIAIAARAEGGKMATADKNKKRERLKKLLRILASYVQGHCNNDLAVLLSSGFTAASRNRARMTVSKGVILSIHNQRSAQLVLSVQAVPNARSYQVRSATVAADGAQGPWEDRGPHTNSRAIRINGLTPGLIYAFQIRAMGGGSTAGDWSDPVRHMCT